MVDPNRDRSVSTETPEEIARIRVLIEEGLKSGFCEDDARTVLRKIMAKRHSTRG
jgi:hypothetical protein